MNIVHACLFQKCINPYDITMVWEASEVIDFSADDEYRFIGYVNYDTELHTIVE